MSDKCGIVRRPRAAREMSRFKSRPALVAPRFGFWLRPGSKSPRCEPSEAKGVPTLCSRNISECVAGLLSGAGRQLPPMRRVAET